MTKIYTLVDPRTNKIRYVGQTKQNLKTRLNGHITDGRTFKYNIPKCEWISELENEGLLPLIVEIECVKNKDANEREKYWISKYRETEDLLNLTIGTTHSRIQEFRSIYAINRYTLERLTFNSYREAANYIGIDKANITKAVYSKKAVKDFYWSKTEFPENWKAPVLKNRVAIELSNNTHIVYLPSIKEAIEYTGGNVSSHKNGAYYALAHSGKEYRGYIWKINRDVHLKPGELLEKPVEVNQQLSLNGNILESSTTNS